MAKAKQFSSRKFGDIRRFPLQNVWRPQRLLLTKRETVEIIIYESLCAAYDHWLETDYGSKPDPRFLLFQLQRSLEAEVRTAWKKFIVERRQA